MISSQRVRNATWGETPFLTPGFHPAKVRAPPLFHNQHYANCFTAPNCFVTAQYTIGTAMNSCLFSEVPPLFSPKYCPV